MSFESEWQSELSELKEIGAVMKNYDRNLFCAE